MKNKLAKLEKKIRIEYGKVSDVNRKNKSEKVPEKLKNKTKCSDQNEKTWLERKDKVKRIYLKNFGEKRTYLDWWKKQTVWVREKYNIILSWFGYV